MLCRALPWEFVFGVAPAQAGQEAGQGRGGWRFRYIVRRRDIFGCYNRFSLFRRSDFLVAALAIQS
jgi:hypothetical protein